MLNQGRASSIIYGIYESYFYENKLSKFRSLVRNFLHLFSKFRCIEGQISNDSKYQSFNSVISVIKCQDLLVRIPINKTVFKNLKDVFHFV